MSLENPRKFISVNQTKSSRSNLCCLKQEQIPRKMLDNTDSETMRTYSCL